MNTGPNMNDRCLTPEVLAYLEQLYGPAACAMKLLSGREAPSTAEVAAIRAQYEVFMSLKLRAAAYEAKQKAGRSSTE